MDKCGICLKQAAQLFETGNEGVYACFKCQPLVPEVTIEDNGEHSNPAHLPSNLQIEIEIESTKEDSEDGGTVLKGSSPYYCAVCQKTFSKNSQLQAHLRNHRAERRFVCTYCDKAFSQSNNLRAHLRIHTNERPYKCSECGKAFTQVTNLNNHVRLHTGERPFVCTEPGCGKAYAQVTNLNQHRKRHLNGRPVPTAYYCPTCGQAFDQRNHMYTHRRTEHGEACGPARKHVCKLCDAVLQSKELLQEHVAQHMGDTTPQQDGEQVEENAEAGGLSCVFRSCGARLASAREHTEHLLAAHQLRVLAPRPAASRRGRPPKHPATQHMVTSSEDEDPLAIKPEFRPIKITNAPEYLPKLKIQSLFQ